MSNDYLAPTPPGMFDPSPMGGGSLAPAGAGSLAPGADTEMMAERRRDLQTINQEVAAAQQNVKAGAQITQDRANDPRLKALREQQVQELMRPPPEPPKPKPQPQAPDPNAMSGSQEWLTAAMFLGSLAGALTRRPLTNALAGFTGAVQGWEAGKTDQFEKSMKQFEAESKATTQANKEANDQYMAVLKSRDLSMEQKELAIKVIAAQYDDQATAQLAEAKQHEAIAQLLDQKIRYGEQFQKSTKEAQQEMWTRAGEQYAKSPEGQRRVQEILNYREAAPSTALRNTPMGFRDAAVMDEVRAQNPQFDTGGFRVAQQERARRIGLYSVADERQVQNQGTAINHLDTLGKLAAALGNGDVNALNSVKQIAQQELGIPAPTNFDGAKQLIGNEIVKAIVNNGGGVTDRQEVSQNLSRARSPEQMSQLIHTYQVLIAAQMAAKKRQYEFSREGVQGAPAFDAAGHLTPKHKELMEEAERSFTQGVNPEAKNDPNVTGAQKSDLQRNLDQIFGVAQKGANALATKGTGIVSDATQGPAVNRYGQTREQMEQSGGMMGEFRRWLGEQGGSIEPMP